MGNLTMWQTLWVLGAILFVTVSVYMAGYIDGKYAGQKERAKNER